MTTSPQTPRSASVGDGVTASFDTGFTFELAAEVRVTVEVAGVTTVAAYSVDYDLSGVASDWLVSGADVVFRVGAIPPAGAIVTLRRATQIDQPDDFGDDQSFAPSQMEAALDRVVRIQQEQDLAREDSEGEVGPAGAQGYPGWSPVFAVVTDGARRVLRVTSWTGGGGTAPTSPVYVGASGFTTVLADAIDIRGAVGATGTAGTNGTNGVDGADGLDAPQIDDLATNSTNPWSSSKIVSAIAAAIAAEIGATLEAHDPDLDALAALSTTGLMARTGAATYALRTLTAPAAGITVTNGDGVSGNPTLVLANDLAALEALAGTNTLYYRSGADTWSAVTIGGNMSFSGGTLNATGFGTGSVTTTGSPASGNLTKFSGGSSITNGNLSGDVTTSDTLVTTIAAGVVTLAKIANASANSKLLGSGAAGSGASYAELTLGTGLSFTGTTLNVSGFATTGAITGSGLTMATARLLGRTTASSGAVEEITVSTGLTFSAGVLSVDATAVKPTESLIIAASDESTALTTGTGKVTFRMPYAFTVTDIRASLTTAQTSGSIFTVDVNEAGTSIISTKLTIDNTEKTTTTAATPAVISDSSLADDAEITVDIDQIGDGTAKGLKVTIIGHRT